MPLRYYGNMIPVKARPRLCTIASTSSEGGVKVSRMSGAGMYLVCTWFIPVMCLVCTWVVLHSEQVVVCSIHPTVVGVLPGADRRADRRLSGPYLHSYRVMVMVMVMVRVPTCTVTVLECSSLESRLKFSEKCQS